jgi:catechol 2,3-dioxygenase-like lactoylglutathione lyase family enzyme
MEKVDGIGGVFFKGRNPESLAAWYRDHLGIPVHDGYADFQCRDKEGEISRTVWSIFPRDTDYLGPDGSGFMINYRVRDLDAMLEQLKTNGIAVEKTENFDYGRFAWITDPEGNRIELWQPLP